MNLPGMPGRSRADDAVLVRSLRSWGDDDLMLTISAAAIILASRHRSSENAILRQMAELAELQDAAEREAARRAMMQ